MKRILFLVSILVAFVISANAQWQQTNGPYGGHIGCLTVSGSNVFAGTWGGGIFLSSNNGSTWTAVNQGLTAPVVFSFAVSGSNIFAGTDGGVFLSADNGANWTAMNTGLPNASVISLAINGNNIFLTF